MKIELDIIKNDKFTVNISYFRRDNPKGVVVVFPGAGYSHMGPCLYYPSGALYESGFEILNLEYDFRREQLKDNNIETYAEFYNFLFAGLDQFELPENKVVLAKSIGTRFIATGNISAFSKIIWLTPALKDDYVLEAILSNSKKSLNIIGSKDRFYEQRRIDQLEQAGVKSLIIADADHGLDIDHDLFRSLDNMKTIMTSILEFVKDEKRIEIV